MFQIIILAATLSLTMAQYGSPYAPPSYGHQSYEPHYAPQPYKFGYEVKDGYGNSLHQQETGDDYNNKKGSYGYTDAYGIYRQVDYIADKYGFRATIKTNEPGTANQDPADVYIYANPVQTSYQPAPYQAASYHPPQYQQPQYKPSYQPPSYHKPSYEPPSYPQPSYSHYSPYKVPAKASYQTQVYHPPAPKYSPPQLSYGKY